MRMPACVLALALAAAPAAAGLFEDDEARKAILELRQRVETLRQDTLRELKAQADDIAQLKRGLLDLANTIELLRQDGARARGPLEQQLAALANEVAALQRQQRDMAQTTEERIRQLEPQQVVVDGRQALVDPQEKRAFDAALAQFKANQFAQAAQSFGEFLARWPRSAYAVQAQYWLGNAWFGARDCKAANDAFMQLAARYPDDARAAEALLSAGTCQLELGDKRAARRTYESIVKLYPQSEEALAARERMAKIR
jgi:tol-pal system protein YbgF